jgi:DNA-binding NtrC family response regulator
LEILKEVPEMEQIETRKGDRTTCPQRSLTGTAKEPSSHRSKAKILVVDDEPQVTETLRQILVLIGFDAETADNGKQAIERIRTGQKFDLIITDMKMPEMDGLEFLKLIRQVRENLPVIILTGHGTLENALDSVEQGAWDYVLKPFRVEKLRAAVLRAISKSRPELKDCEAPTVAADQVLHVTLKVLFATHIHTSKPVKNLPKRLAATHRDA